MKRSGDMVCAIRRSFQRLRAVLKEGPPTRFLNKFKAIPSGCPVFRSTVTSQESYLVSEREREMNRRRIAVVTVLAAALSLPALSGIVRSATSQATQVRVPINFTLTPTECPKLKVTVVGSGELFSVINSR